jgi:hypothetical protein
VKWVPQTQSEIQLAAAPDQESVHCMYVGFVCVQDSHGPDIIALDLFGKLFHWNLIDR